MSEDMLKNRGHYPKVCWLLLVVLLVGGAIYLEAASRFDPAALAPPSGPLVLDRHGQILRLVAGLQGLRSVKLPTGEIPHLVAAAFITAEDQRFWQHPGVDLAAVFRAAGQNLAAAVGGLARHL